MPKSSVVSTLKSDVVSTLKSNVVPKLKFNVETTLKMECFPDVEIKNVVSTLKIGCSTSQPKINLRTTFKQCYVPAGLPMTWVTGSRSKSGKWITVPSLYIAEVSLNATTNQHTERFKSHTKIYCHEEIHLK